VPTSACLRTARIWLSLNFDRFMQNFLQVRKFYFSDPQLDAGITLRLMATLDSVQPDDLRSTSDGIHYGP
jgi:hypothetical protein